MLRSFTRPRVSNDNPYSKLCSAKPSSGPITLPGRSPAMWRRASGWRLLWTSTTTGTATAASSSSRPTSVTAGLPTQSAGGAPNSKRRPARRIQDAGADPLAAGANTRKCGSTSHQKLGIKQGDKFDADCLNGS